MHTAPTTIRHAVPAVRTITLDHPWRWLSAGWRDMVRTPWISFTYGAVFALLGYILMAGLTMMGAGYLILPLAMGFALVAPAAAIGLYDTSRRLEAGEAPSLGTAMGAVTRNSVQVGIVGIFLLIALIAWMRLAMLEFMLFFGAAPPALGGIIDAILLSDRGMAFLAVGTATGGIIAALVFAMTAIAIPMLVARPDTDAMSAMLASLSAVRHNLKPMILWAAMIGVLTVLGLALFFVGLAITLPLLGHASWHAYRDMAGDDR